MTAGLAVTPLDAATILIVLAAVLGYLNQRFLRLPQSVGLTLMGAVASLCVIAVDRLIPGSRLAATAAQFVDAIDFHATLMDGMLSFLLFAGALHVDWSEMRRGRWPILALSTGGVVLSTLLIGGGFYWLCGARPCRAFGLVSCVRRPRQSDRSGRGHGGFEDRQCHADAQGDSRRREPVQ